MAPMNLSMTLASLLASIATSLGLPSPGVAAPAAPSNGSGSAAGSCLCYPGDSCWPTQSTWDSFNQTVGGKLIATIPVGSVCHNNGLGHYDQAACAQLQAAWGDVATHYTTSSSVMTSYFANASCDPFNGPSAQCIIGTYVQYAVDARTVEDYQNTLSFVKQHNIRLVVRNTGHDYLGKSTGAGAVAIWTHNLKDISIQDYQSKNYNGKALKVGAGIQLQDAYAFARQNGVTVVGGNCESVGLAGGYSQGGGHSLLASTYGLAADQVLEWEAVTVAGDHITATPYNEHQDLYWALSGGGGGTYAVVYSATIKAHATTKASGANMTFVNSGVSQDVFWGAIGTWLTTMPAITDAKGGALWLLTNTTFILYPAMLPNGTKDQIQKLMQPTLNYLTTNNMTYTYYVNEWSTWGEAFDVLNGPEPVANYNSGGRLLDRSLFQSKSGVQKVIDAMKYLTSLGAAFSGMSLNADITPSSPNAVFPGWRSAGIDAVVGIPYNNNDFASNAAARSTITNQIIPRLEQISPNSGCYLNEADFNQPNWQKEFYGANYPALLKVKNTYDPNDVLYALTGVGSEAWTQPDGTGRLCRAK